VANLTDHTNRKIAKYSFVGLCLCRFQCITGKSNFE
jgi:hypothetical protein